MKAKLKSPIKLLPLFRERVWGKTSLAPFFSKELTAPDLSDKERIGEVWFTFTENMTSSGKNLGETLREEPGVLGTAGDPQHPGVCPILVKLLFTTERLSVQVHPDDEYAARHHQSLGKTEAWYVLDSQPPGELAVGFREHLTPDQFKDGIISGAIEDQLDWRKVEAGEVIFVPAGTVHAIGAGLTICEIQENSDITYRLYDYGRPRELHVEHGATVSHLKPHTHEAQKVQLDPGRDELAACEYFRIERLRPKQSLALPAALPYYSILICTKGDGTLDGENCRAGEAWLVPAGSAAVAVEATGSEWIWTYSAGEPAAGVAVS